MCEDIGIGPYRSVRNVDAAQGRLPFLRRAAAHQVFKHRDQHAALFDTLRIGLKARVRSQVTPARCLTEALPLTVITDRKDDPTVLRGKKLIRDDLKMRITLPRRNDSTAQIR